MNPTSTPTAPLAAAISTVTESWRTVGHGNTMNAVRSFLTTVSGAEMAQWLRDNGNAGRHLVFDYPDAHHATLSVMVCDVVGFRLHADPTPDEGYLVAPAL